MAFLLIDAQPESPRIFLDGEYWGEVGRWHQGVVVVPSGQRRLELRAEGFYPYRADLELEPDTRYTLRVQLVERYE